jgi:hypothetical protein
MKTCMRTINAAMVAIVLVTSGAAQDSKCPVGLKYVGRLHYETNADNGHETKTVAFPVGIGLDPTYQQSNLKCSGGGSDAETRGNPGTETQSPRFGGVTSRFRGPSTVS